MKTLEEVMASLSPERRAKAEARGRELIQEEILSNQIVISASTRSQVCDGRKVHF
ncbi:hypothetical protein LOY42_04875 [Pseudomonas sp. B21-023]|uniref:hypothetical protein n=1 Tax=unclassified Pseudomonas TaxID=196821 RepID=UPI001E4D7DAF|nr:MULTISPECIES: hypothetical protein [unclassified Pseudomonas]UVL20231.1 hypothetical protein LOY44_04825 [Pseudomonas sp. B21-044]UVM17648.1 hypothetical protein LOY42_04875 [Pseudomonas sp. B21-023]